MPLNVKVATSQQRSGMFNSSYPGPQVLREPGEAQGHIHYWASRRKQITLMASSPWREIHLQPALLVNYCQRCPRIQSVFLRGRGEEIQGSLWNRQGRRKDKQPPCSVTLPAPVRNVRTVSRDECAEGWTGRRGATNHLGYQVEGWGRLWHCRYSRVWD